MDVAPIRIARAAVNATWVTYEVPCL
jgi:hypothetical protein